MRLPPLLVVALLAAGCVTDPGAAGDEETFPALRVETRLGTFTAIVFEDETPATAAFMAALVGDGYYDGRAFGRVIPGFVIQEVDRAGGTTDQSEKVVGEFGTRVMFSAGAFGIARDADPDSGGSEFFVMDHAVSSLWGNYTAFAQVVEGMDVVHAIARVPAVKTGPAGSVAGAPPGSPVSFGVHDRVPVDPVVMTKVEWVEVALPREEAAKYPLRVGETVRVNGTSADPAGLDPGRQDGLRLTLEWPADLRVGAPSGLTWWVSARDATPAGQTRDPPPPDLEGLEVRVDGASNATLAPEVDADVGRVGFSWTPGAAGAHAVRLLRGGEELAVTVVDVPPAP